MVGVNLANEIGGNVYSFEEVASWCRTAGLTEIHRYRLRLPGVHLIRASKR